MRFGVFVTGASLVTAVAAFGADRLAKSANSISRIAVDDTSNSTALPPSQDPWYDAPAGYESATPGTILKIRSAPGNIVNVTTNSSAIYNILYRTTNSQYNPSWAVTTVFIPTNPDCTKFLSYQIPYDSANIDSGPSYTLSSTPEPDITTALGKGWIVSSPDYEGPLASFTAGVQSGHATLDSVRAVLSAGLGISANGSTRYALWGYSGGALASEWAAELQVQYAPELDFAGAALGGLTPNVTNVLIAVDATIYAGLIPAGIVGVASQYPELQTFLNQSLKTSGPYNITGFYATKGYSLIQNIGTYLNVEIGQYFTNGINLLFAPVAQKVIARDGVMGYHGLPQFPLFAYKAIGDEISPVADTDELIDRYCLQTASNILYHRNTIGNHVTEEGNGDARAVAFLTEVLEGNWNHTGCLIQNVTVSADNATAAGSLA